MDTADSITFGGYQAFASAANAFYGAVARTGPTTAIVRHAISATWNKERGGATDSQHLHGTAADIYGKLAGVADATLRQKIEDIAMQLNVFGGVGHGARYIVHVDVRGRKARWKY